MSKKDTCGECRGYKDRTKCPRWRVPRPDDPACLNFVLKSPSPAVEPEDTDASIYKGCKTCDEHTIVRLSYELAEAKERLETSRAINCSQKKRCLYAEQELAEAKTTLERLRRRQLTCDDCLRSDRTELAEAKAEIEALRKDCDYLRRESGRAGNARIDARRQLAEAKAEIEKWRKSAQVYRDRYILALNDRNVAQAELEIKNEDAEIGRLVRGMRDGTRLEHDSESYWTYLYEGQGVWSPINDNQPTTDPADALRAIQEVADAEA